MLILRLGSTCSMEISSDMPPYKRLKTESIFKRDLPEIVDVASESESEVVVDITADWRDRCRSLREKYSYVLSNSVLTDVKLIVGEQRRFFDCHRLILALGSPVFEAMFFGDLAERGDTVTIPDVDPEGFENLIRFLYTGEYDVKNDAAAFKTYFAADKYCVSELRKRCESSLCIYEVTPINVWLFFENSLLLNSTILKNRCIDVLKDQLKPSFEQSGFLDTSFSTIEYLLSLDDLNVSEEKILKSLIMWAEHHSQMEGADSFENTLKPLLSNIRFGALTAKEFVSLRHTTRLKEVLNDDDSLLILEHLVNPGACELPSWCCPKTGRFVKPPVSEKEDATYYPCSKAKKRKTKQDKREHSSTPIYSTSSSSSSSSSSDLSSSDTSDSFD